MALIISSRFFVLQISYVCYIIKYHHITLFLILTKFLPKSEAKSYWLTPGGWLKYFAFKPQGIETCVCVFVCNIVQPSGYQGIVYTVTSQYLPIHLSSYCKPQVVVFIVNSVSECLREDCVCISLCIEHILVSFLGKNVLINLFKLQNFPASMKIFSVVWPWIASFELKSHSDVHTCNLLLLCVVLLPVLRIFPLSSKFVWIILTFITGNEKRIPVIFIVICLTLLKFFFWLYLLLLTRDSVWICAKGEIP